MEQIHKVYVNREFNCSPSELYLYFTQPELMVKWFGPKDYVVVDFLADLQVGGTYTIRLKSSKQKTFAISGTYLRIHAPHNLRFSFSYKDLRHPPPDSIVDIHIEALGSDRSHLKLYQSFEILPQDMPERKQVWEKLLEKLEKELVNGYL